jgi:DNA-binding response OmpR family regulator
VLIVNKILIIDDEPQIRHLVQKRIEHEGYEAITASGGVEGITMARTQRPDLILLDIMMPEMDGYTTLSKLKGSFDTQRIPVIMFSAQSDAASRDKSNELGASHYLEKPVIPETLRSKIKAVLSAA